jgi:hypothetical protein
LPMVNMYASICVIFYNMLYNEDLMKAGLYYNDTTILHKAPPTLLPTLESIGESLQSYILTLDVLTTLYGDPYYTMEQGWFCISGGGVPLFHKGIQTRLPTNDGEPFTTMCNMGHTKLHIHVVCKDSMEYRGQPSSPSILLGVYVPGPIPNGTESSPYGEVRPAFRPIPGYDTFVHVLWLRELRCSLQPGPINPRWEMSCLQTDSMTLLFELEDSMLCWCSLYAHGVTPATVCEAVLGAHFNYGTATSSLRGSGFWEILKPVNRAGPGPSVEGLLSCDRSTTCLYSYQKLMVEPSRQDTSTHIPLTWLGSGDNLVVYGFYESLRCVSSTLYSSASADQGVRFPKVEVDLTNYRFHMVSCFTFHVSDCETSSPVRSRTSWPLVRGRFRRIYLIPVLSGCCMNRSSPDTFLTCWWEGDEDERLLPCELLINTHLSMLVVGRPVQWCSPSGGFTSCTGGFDFLAEFAATSGVVHLQLTVVDCISRRPKLLKLHLVWLMSESRSPE